MPRRLKIKTQEMGYIELQLIYQTGELWEPEWSALQGTDIGDMLPVVSDVVANHAIRGWTKPFVEALGLPPQGALRKIPSKQQVCAYRDRCPYYDPHKCTPSSKKMPDCFQPDSVVEAARTLAYEVIRLWREGVYVVIVKESIDAYRSYPRAR